MFRFVLCAVFLSTTLFASTGFAKKPLESVVRCQAGYKIKITAGKKSLHPTVGHLEFGQPFFKVRKGYKKSGKLILEAADDLQSCMIEHTKSRARLKWSKTELIDYLDCTLHKLPKHCKRKRNHNGGKRYTWNPCRGIAHYSFDNLRSELFRYACTLAIRQGVAKPRYSLEGRVWGHKCGRSPKLIKKSHALKCKTGFKKAPKAPKTVGDARKGYQKRKKKMVQRWLNGLKTRTKNMTGYPESNPGELSPTVLVEGLAETNDIERKCREKCKSKGNAKKRCVFHCRLRESKGRGGIGRYEIGGKYVSLRMIAAGLYALHSEYGRTLSRKKKKGHFKNLPPKDFPKIVEAWIKREVRMMDRLAHTALRRNTNMPITICT